MAQIIEFPRFKEAVEEPELVIECYCCGGDIHEGETMYEDAYGEYYCSTECVAEELTDRKTL